MARPRGGPAQPLGGARVLGVLEGLRDHAGLGAVVRYDDHCVAHEIALEHEVVAELIAGKDPNRDALGQPIPELGKRLGLIGLCGPEDPDWICCISLNVQLTAERQMNVCVVDFKRHVGADVAYRAFPACVAAWSPDWGCLESDANANVRVGLDYQGEEPPPPVDRILHWRTYFGPKRLRELDLDALQGRDGALVRPLHEGAEVILGERWESDETLLARQRELEPLLFDGVGAAA